MHILAVTFFITLLIAGLALLGRMVRRDGRIMLDALLGRHATKFVADFATGQVIAMRGRRPAAGRGFSLQPQRELRAAA